MKNLLEKIFSRKLIKEYECWEKWTIGRVLRRGVQWGVVGYGLPLPLSLRFCLAVPFFENERFLLYYHKRKTKNTVVTDIVKENTYQNALFIVLKRMVSTVSSALCFWPQIAKDHAVLLLTTDTANVTISKKKALVIPVTAITNRQSTRLME